MLILSLNDIYTTDWLNHETNRTNEHNIKTKENNHYINNNKNPYRSK
jgi:hypothetical protein